MHGRTFNLFLAFVCHELLVAAYYFQYVEGLNPCPLCIIQRVVVFALGVWFLLMAGVNAKPGGMPAKLLNGVGVLISATGIVAAGRQVWLQSLPPADIPACGPDLAFMLESFSAGEILTELFKGSGDCAKVDWTFLGFSMGAWMLAVFSLFALFFLLRALRK
jgi:disulfide bond formation protein DsbB